MNIQTISSQSTDFSFKPVRGYSDREQTIKNLFSQNRQLIHQDAQKLLENMEQETDHSTRLLYHKDRPVGALAYQKSLKNTAFEVNTFLVAQGILFPNATSLALLNKATDKAKELNAQAIHISVSRNDPLSELFLRSQRFVDYLQGDDKISLRKNLQEAIPIPIPTSNSSSTAPVFYKHCSLKKPYIIAMQKGSKTVEGRIHTGMFSSIKEGEHIRFFCQDAEVFCKIVKKNTYSSFQQMLSTEGYKKCIPEAQSLEKAVAIYEAIPGYSQRAQTFGVVALQIQTMPKPVQTSSSSLATDRPSLKRSYQTFTS